MSATYATESFALKVCLLLLSALMWAWVFTWAWRSSRPVLTFARITFADGCTLFCEVHEIPSNTEGADAGWAVELVRMTRAEYEALPEFES